EEWGERSVERFRGMFAFAIWDADRRQLLLARDRLGKKPLYYLNDRDRVIFASEIKAILEVPGVSPQIDLTALSDYLSLLYVPAPKTIFESIRKLPAAHYAIATRDSLEIKPYWDLSFEPRHNTGEAQMMDELVGILDEATRMRMISEVPLGAFLSGGIDSATVVALMARNSDQPVVTNSIAFNVSTYDEAAYARKVAGRFSTDHHEFAVTPEAVPIVEKLAWHYDEPFADSSAVPTYYVSKTARQNVTVALSGDGGDENFAGYRKYYFDLKENAVRNLFPKTLREPLFGALGRIYPKADYLPQIFRGKSFLSNVAKDPVEAYFFSASTICEEDKRKLLNPDVLARLGDYRTSELFHKIYRNAPASDHLSRLQYLDIKTYLCDDILTKVDRASMAVSLEVRCPLLDHVFMEYAARVPSSLKLHGGVSKYIFKNAVAALLPPDITSRKKMGFSIPIAKWFRGELREMAETALFDRTSPGAGLFDINHVRRLWDGHLSGMRDFSQPLWILLSFQLWAKVFHTGKIQ
ncbi:MAG TPA: asparagine synthase (glutamine-hydrolyzing), partial [Syntrophobacteraceae bacterium]|nr:asparagine synthase (glutamine-hydrolyzing) [Syntrophobacteraceae bacterium]